MLPMKKKKRIVFLRFQMFNYRIFPRNLFQLNGKKLTTWRTRSASWRTSSKQLLVRTNWNSKRAWSTPNWITTCWTREKMCLHWLTETAASRQLIPNLSTRWEMIWPSFKKSLLAAIKNSIIFDWNSLHCWVNATRTKPPGSRWKISVKNKRRLNELRDLVKELTEPIWSRWLKCPSPTNRCKSTKITVGKICSEN